MPWVSTSVSCTTNSTTALTARPRRKYAYLHNTSAYTIFLTFGPTATLNTGIPVLSSGYYEISPQKGNMTDASVAAIASTAATLLVHESYSTSV